MVVQSRDSIIELLRASKISKTKIMKFIKENKKPLSGGGIARRASITFLPNSIHAILANEYNEFLSYSKKHLFDENVEAWMLLQKCVNDNKYLIPFNEVYTDIINTSVKFPIKPKDIQKVALELEENMKSQLGNYLNMKKNRSKSI